MSALMWWLIPLGATFLAVCYAMYRGRPERPMEGQEGMQTLRAFQEAMNRPMPPELPLDDRQSPDTDEPRR
ncbi:MAG TPA: hypothetical protein DDY88_03700 [Actinobacteria bacterium]|nr:hypothetical protein [Actinomycetota bacterium]